MKHAIEVAKEVKRLGTDNGIEEGTPMIFAALNKAAIMEISKLENVLEIYADEVCSQLMDSARRSTRAHIVNNRGYKGNGIKVGVVRLEVS